MFCRIAIGESTAALQDTNFLLKNIQHRCLEIAYPGSDASGTSEHIACETSIRDIEHSCYGHPQANKRRTLQVTNDCLMVQLTMDLQITIVNLEGLDETANYMTDLTCQLTYRDPCGNVFEVTSLCLPVADYQSRQSTAVVLL